MVTRLPRVSVGIALMLVAFTSVTDAQGQTGTDALKALEQRIARAWTEADRDTLDEILTDDWKVIDVAGRLRTKADVLGDMFGPNAPRIQDVSVDEIAVRLLSDVAVVTGRTVFVVADGTAVTLRFTDVAILRDQRWRVVASQGTPVAE